MKNIWAVSRHTFSECLRMKIAVAFLLILAGALAVLPFMMTGDGTLAGSIRTFLSYSVAIIGLLLSVVTVLVTTRIISDDVGEKHIYLLAAKPLARWEYILGRWFGVVMLNAVLLGIAGMSVYFMVQHLRVRAATSSHDRQVVETEIFSARAEVKPEMPDIGPKVEKRIAELKKAQTYDNVVEEFRLKGNITVEKARELLFQQLSQEELSKLEVAPSNGWLKWTFRNVDIAGQAQQGRGKILIANKESGAYLIEGPTWLAGHLVQNGYVDINGVQGRVQGVGADKTDGQFAIIFAKTERENSVIKELKKDQDVEIVVEPTFQFRYQVTPIGSTGGRDSVYRVLTFSNPPNPPAARFEANSPIKTMTSVTVPVLESLRTGDIEVGYRNISAPRSGPMQFYVPANPVQISYKDVSILYKIGGFNANFFRAMLLVFCQLVFLAALGVFFGCWLSFPVAVLACLVLFVCGLLLNWMADSVKWSSRGEGFNFVGVAGSVVLWITTKVMPDFALTSPSERLVDGLFISWKDVWDAAYQSVLIGTVCYLAIACLIFHKRELARVQV